MWQTTKSGGRGNCKYYKACGNTENCKRCEAYTRAKKNENVKK